MEYFISFIEFVRLVVEVLGSISTAADHMLHDNHLKVRFDFDLNI